MAQDRGLPHSKVRSGNSSTARTPQRVTQRQRQEHLSRGARMPRPLSSPACTINMIIGGSDETSMYSIKFTSTQKLKRSITHERSDGLKESIIFDKSDADGLTFPHNDALVITLCILDTDVRRIMFDELSGANYPSSSPCTVAYVRELDDKIASCCITLAGFNDIVEWTSGEITLPVLAIEVMLETAFHIMD
uniref:Uncharacterized protein n=1 Tax=Nicotiana tabacum TaxID=4097 RepID=A0A1S3XVN3_TOBAC|nr:PREDICTED: uncharacterized protein LOC107769247 [Nicotiana tabacum]